MEYVSDRMSYLVLRGRWSNVIVLNVHAPSKQKSDDSKDCFYVELQQVSFNFSKYHMKILSGDFNAKVGRENTFKLTTGNDSPYQDNNDNGVRIINLPHQKIWLLRARCYHTELL